MKHIITLYFLFFFTGILSAQTLEDYFSRPGLKLNSYIASFNGIGFDESSASFSYTGKRALCEDTVLIFAYNQGLGYRYVLIEEKKVYQVFSDCTRELMYDFGVDPGEKVTEGIYADHVVIGRNEVTLENGEVRLLFELLPPQSSWSVKWIEGIGNIEGGFFPVMHYESYDVFVCAHDSSGMLWSNSDANTLCDSLSCLQPRPNFTHEINEYEIKLINESTFATHYLWDFGDGHTSIEINPVYQYPEANCNSVSLKAYNECYTEDKVRTIVLSVCIENDWDTLYKYKEFGNFTFSLNRISDHLQFIIHNPEILRSIDNGNTWHNASVPLLGSYENFWGIRMYDAEIGLGIARRHGNINSGGIIKTFDGGLTWHLRAPNTPELNRLTIGTNGRAWASSFYNKYYLSQDFGETWFDLSDSVDVDLDQIWAFGDTLIASVVERPLNEPKFAMAKSFDGGSIGLTLGFRQT